MQMRVFLCSPSLPFDSANLKYGVLTGRYLRYSCHVTHNEVCPLNCVTSIVIGFFYSFVCSSMQDYALFGFFSFFPLHFCCLIVVFNLRTYLVRITFLFFFFLIRFRVTAISFLRFVCFSHF